MTATILHDVTDHDANFIKNCHHCKFEIRIRNRQSIHLYVPRRMMVMLIMITEYHPDVRLQMRAVEIMDTFLMLLLLYGIRNENELY